MKVTEANIAANDNVLVTLGSREVYGFHSKGTGFLIKAKAELLFEGVEYDGIKDRFEWCRVVLKIKPESITQTL